MLFAKYSKRANLDILGVGNTVDALLMTIIGGVGIFNGPVIGASDLHSLDVLLGEAVPTS